MEVSAEFIVTYWGATGSLTRPLLPQEVTAKLARAMRHLGERGDFDELKKLAADEASLIDFLQRKLPFHLRSSYGGNTSCVEIETADGLLILDAGSGLRELGVALNRRWKAPSYQGRRQGHLLLTHCHMDHTYAIPFFDPFYDAENDFTIWAPQVVIDSLNAVMSPTAALMGTYFPPSFEAMVGLKRCRAIETGASFSIDGTSVSTHALNHPGGCMAYRFERAGRKIVFASDHEHAASPDPALAEFARNADLLYLDAQYRAAEYEGREGILDDPPASRRGWGHSTVEDCIPTAVAAGVRRLHLGHHDPKRDDDDLARLEEFARSHMQKALAAASRYEDACEVRMVAEQLRVEV